MKRRPSSILRGMIPVRPGGMLGDLLHGVMFVGLGFAIVVAVAAGLLYLRVSAAPLAFAGLPERVSGAIASQIGTGWAVGLSEASIEIEDGSLALRAAGLEIRNPQGILVVRAPHAIVSVETLPLLIARLKPRAIEFRDLQLRAAIGADGSLSLAPAGEVIAAEASAPGPAAAGGEPAASAAGPAAPSPVSTVVASLFDLVLEPGGIVGALDRARFRNARLVLVDPTGRQRATFDKVDASFERLSTAARRFTLELEGPVGRWSLGGEVRETGEGRSAAVTASNIPAADLQLFSGLSDLPGRADLKLSARAEASVAGGRLTRLEAQVDSGRGTILVDDKDVSPIPVEAASAEASWDEGARALSLKALAFKGGGSEVRLSGALSMPERGPWRLSLAGRDALFSGLGKGDPIVRVEAIEAALSGGEGRLLLDHLRLRAPDLNGTVQGSYAAAGDGAGLRVKVQAGGTGVRTALRLWPEPVASPVRRYLASNLKRGRIENLDVDVALTPDELVEAFRGGSVPGSGVRVGFALRETELFLAEGLPSLTKGAVSGSVTGNSALVRSAGAQVQLLEGRALTFSDAAFVLENYQDKSKAAKLSFRLDGGADALAALLQTPVMREATDVELDPAGIRGRADLRVSLPLALSNMPAVADLPISISGTVADLSIDKLFGRERLEGANLNISYESGALQIRGEGKAAGGPATIDIRQARGGQGEAAVSVVLDEAARARKGLTFGAQLAGPVPVRAVVPLGKGGKSGMRIEADLGRATIDNVIPGWTKPAGRPGRLAFSLGETPQDLRDLVLDSGPVQARGAVTLSPEGHLDRAELSSFKLSPGDDMRLRLERSGGVHKVTVRGAVADARPFARGISAPASASASAVPKDREVDLDLAVNILTGFNDEAVTGATIKAMTRGRDLRQFQLNGRFRSATVSGQLTRAERGSQQLVLKSDDAGAALRYFDVYRRVVGGTLNLQISMGDGPQAGTIVVDSFALRNEPALKRIISQQPPAAMAEDRAGATASTRLDVNEVGFTRAQGSFIRTSGRLDFNEAVIWGPMVGFTANGWIDYARDRTDISGTFVPAYGLNNVFAQVPLFGPLLGGGQHEGLFAINFRVSGGLAAPTLTVNPLSAVAPGFLRKLFGAGGPGNAAAAPPTLGER